MNITGLLTLLAAVTTFLSVWLLILTLLILKQNQFFSKFTQGVQKRDLKTVEETLVRIIPRLVNAF